jgi:autotransporter-associated beta strand protein
VGHQFVLYMPGCGLHGEKLMKWNLRRRSCALLAAAAAWAGTEHVWAGVSFDGTSRITLRHDADTSNAGDVPHSSGQIAVPTSASIFPINPYQLDHTFSSGGSSTDAAGSLGQVTNATTASFVLASGTGVTQNDPTDLYPGKSSLKFDVNLLWNVTAGGFGPLANGYASLTAAGTVGAGGSAELHINLNFLNQNGTALRSPWIVDKVWPAGPFSEPITTSRVLGTGALPSGSKLRITGTIEFLASNADSPTNFEAMRVEVGGSPPIAVFATDGSGSWFDRSNWQLQVPNPNEPGLLTIPNGIGHRASFAGTLKQLVHNVSLGSEIITLGTLDVTSPTPWTFTGEFPVKFETQQGNAVIDIRGARGNHSIQTPVQLVDTVEVITAGTSLLNMSGPISGAGGIIKLGSGELILSGRNSYSGTTTIVEGTLLAMNSEGGFGTGSGNVTVLGGATLGGIGVIGGIVTAKGGSGISPGDGIGALTVKGLVLEAGSTVDIEGLGEMFDGIYLTGTDTHTFDNAKVNLIERSSFAPGTYTLFHYNGEPVRDLSGKLSLTNRLYSGAWARLFDDEKSTSIMLNIAPVPQWNVDANGSWGTSGNWLPTVVPSGPNALAGFLGKITAPGTVSLNGNRAVGTIIFDNANKYTIARGTSGTLSVGDALNRGEIHVVGGGHEISAPLSMAGDLLVDVASGQSLTLSGSLKADANHLFTKNGEGMLTISGAQSYGSNSKMVVNGGTINLNSNPGVPGSPSASTLALDIVGSKVVLGTSVDLQDLSVDFSQAGTQTLDLNSPAASGGHNAVRVYAADLNAAKSALYGAIVNAAGPANPLDGIVDSNLHANSGIGIAKRSDHVLVRSTRIGDLNLDGTVTISDFIDLAAHFNQIGTATWEEGDLNYDRSVTIADFIDLAANFNSSYSGETWAISGEEQVLLNAFAAAHAAVSEPGAMGLVFISAGVLGRRRRSRS